MIEPLDLGKYDSSPAFTAARAASPTSTSWVTLPKGEQWAYLLPVHHRYIFLQVELLYHLFCKWSHFYNLSSVGSASIWQSSVEQKRLVLVLKLPTEEHKGTQKWLSKWGRLIHPILFKKVNIQLYRIFLPLQPKHYPVEELKLHDSCASRRRRPSMRGFQGILALWLVVWFMQPLDERTKLVEGIAF